MLVETNPEKIRVGEGFLLSNTCQLDDVNLYDPLKEAWSFLTKKWNNNHLETHVVNMNANLKFEQRAIVLAASSSTKHEGHIWGMAYLMIQSPC